MTDRGKAPAGRPVPIDDAAAEMIDEVEEVDDDEVQVWVVDDEGERDLAAAAESAVEARQVPEPGEGAEVAEEGAAEAAEAEELRRELDQVRNQWLRTVADLDNFRKRTEREQRDARRYALVDPMRDLLTVVDNLERAVAAGGTVEDLKQGVELTLRQLRDTLRVYGVDEIPAVGAAFDPNLHDAVSRHEEPLVEVPTVSAELQRGYRLHDRLLRPALVKVAMPVAGSGGARENGAGEAEGRDENPQ